MLAVRRFVRTVGVLALGAALAAGCSSSDSDDPAPGGAAAPPTSAAAAAGVQHLDPAGFATAIGASGTVLLDVRTPEEFAAGHLPKAVNVNMQGADFAAQLAKLDTSARYALYCRTGHRSGVAAEQMRAAGFTNVVDLAGGITAWAGEGRPVTTG